MDAQIGFPGYRNIFSFIADGFFWHDIKLEKISNKSILPLFSPYAFHFFKILGKACIAFFCKEYQISGKETVEPKGPACFGCQPSQLLP
jgi:hypothetical protein